MPSGTITPSAPSVQADFHYSELCFLVPLHNLVLPFETGEWADPLSAILHGNQWLLVGPHQAVWCTSVCPNHWRSRSPTCQRRWWEGGLFGHLGLCELLKLTLNILHDMYACSYYSTNTFVSSFAPRKEGNYKKRVPSSGHLRFLVTCHVQSQGMHTFVAGTPARVSALTEVLGRLRELPGVAFATAAQVSSAVTQGSPWSAEWHDMTTKDPWRAGPRPDLKSWAPYVCLTVSKNAMSFDKFNLWTLLEVKKEKRWAVPMGKVGEGTTSLVWDWNPLNVLSPCLEPEKISIFTTQSFHPVASLLGFGRGAGASGGQHPGVVA